MTQAVFLDKDGTLVEDASYSVDLSRMRLLPGVLVGLRALHRAGYRLIVISNQSGVARGLFPEEALVAVERRLQWLLADGGVPLAGFYYCPHHPNGSISGYALACTCRKPEPGLILRAATEHGIQLTHSWLVGNRLEDVKAGQRAGCRTILLGSCRNTGAELPGGAPHHLATDFCDATLWILNSTPPVRQLQGVNSHEEAVCCTR